MRRRGPLTGADWKAIRNFRKFLEGKGSRCPSCNHKAAKHWVRCTAGACSCQLSSGDVLAVRAQLKAPGWEGDER